MTQFYVKVVPDCEEFSIDRGTYPEVSLTEKAENGRANTELKEKIGEILGTSVGIVSGHKSSRKKLAVDMEEQEVEKRLEEHYD